MRSLAHRLAQHFRRQDWMAVAIEFVIVIVGVFIGIQAANWNEGRLEARQERALVMRLIDEAHQSDAGLAGAIASNSKRLTAAQRLHEALLTRATPDDGGKQITSDFFELGPWSDAGIVRATLDQAVSSGQIALIGSDDLKAEIAKYRENVMSLSDGVQNLGSMNLDHVTTVYDHVDFRFGKAGPELVSSPAEMVRDPIVRRRIGQYVLVYSVIRDYENLMRQSNRRYTDRLTAYAHKRKWL